MLGTVWAGADTVQPAPAHLKLDVGADLRFSEAFADNLLGFQANQSATTATDPQRTYFYSYSRPRTRLWSRFSLDDQYLLYARVANEFRFYHNHTQLYPFPNEIFIDNLYLDMRGVVDERLDIRVGRQDMRYGGGRVIRNGTPGDFRSIYFNALKTTLWLSDKSSLDLAGVWQQAHDPWTINDADVDLNRYQRRKGGTDLAERGAFAYYTNREDEELRFEFYHVYMEESRWFSTSNARLPPRRYHTLGTRVTPRFSEYYSAEVELAAQHGTVGGSGSVGERDIWAWMGYGAATGTAADWLWQPDLTAAVLILSGDDQRFDDPNARGTDSGWNPVMGRGTWTSEIMSAQYSMYRLSNLVYPHLETSINFASDHALKLQAGPHYAYQIDNSNGDNFRGYLSVVRYIFPVLRKSSQRRGRMHGELKYEATDGGGYYRNSGYGYYLRLVLFAYL